MALFPPRQPPEQDLDEPGGLSVSETRPESKREDCRGPNGPPRHIHQKRKLTSAGEHDGPAPRQWCSVIDELMTY